MRRSPAHPGSIDAVGITCQRASAIVWDRGTGEPVGPGLGWQDLRTIGECMVAKAEHGLALAPNQSATKLQWLLANTPDAARTRPVLRHGRLVAGVDVDRRRGSRDRPHQRRRHRACCGPMPAAGTTVCSTRCGIPAECPARTGRLQRHRCARHRAAGLPADRRARRRPAGIAGRAGLCAPRSGQGHVRNRRHARHLSWPGRAPIRRPATPRHLPDRGLVDTAAS